MLSQAKIKKLLSLVLARERREGAGSVHLVGDRRMRRLQAAHRGQDKTTDVLSFAAAEGEGPDPGGELGDIFLSVPQIRRQAREWRVSAEEEFARMLIHGLLHLLGYDHIHKKEAAVMFARQEKYLAAWPR